MSKTPLHITGAAAVLVHRIESCLYKREGKAVNNFALTLPKPQSDLAMQRTKAIYEKKGYPRDWIEKRIT